jgi:hypothetical protein
MLAGIITVLHIQRGLNMRYWADTSNNNQGYMFSKSTL